MWLSSDVHLTLVAMAHLVIFTHLPGVSDGPAYDNGRVRTIPTLELMSWYPYLCQTVERKKW
jgi:hypothetical protein